MTDIDKDVMGKFLFRHREKEVLREDIQKNNDKYKYWQNIRLKIINIIKRF